MSTTVIITLNIEDGPGIELTPEQFNDLCKQIDMIRNAPLTWPPMGTPVDPYPEPPYVVTTTS